MRREKLEEFQRKIFGKPISEMDKLEKLNALSVVSNKLYAYTGEEKYDDLEKIALSFLDSEIKGIPEEEACRIALEEAEVKRNEN